jgi:glycosyltransferase involved in cell wall biosynthesis
VGNSPEPPHFAVDTEAAASSARHTRLPALDICSDFIGATRHPEWSIVLIGKKCVDTSPLDVLSNVHFLGRKPHSELPAYCKGLDVALIPHKVNELTRHMNRIKLREYLSAGLQIVSTDLPGMQHLPDYCIVAKDYESFEAGVKAALRGEVMRHQTWDHKLEELGETVLRVKAQKVRPKRG